MKTKLIITIDTEEDNWGNYRCQDHRVENVKQIPMLQSLFDRYGAVPTYLVNWPVLMDPQACRILQDLHNKGRCEIGSHCHPWNTPPLEEEINEANSMMCNLPEKLIKEKMARLAAATEEKMQVRPRSFRAGRWGFGRYVAEALIENEYSVDSSVCPDVDWRSEFGPDYSNAPVQPYRFDPASILEPADDGRLQEIPASIGFLQGNTRIWKKVRKLLSGTQAKRLHLTGLLDRLKVMNFRWLSPELSSAADMISLAQALIKKGHLTLNLSFHSTTLLPGMSPYVKSQQDLNAFLYRIEETLKFAVDNNLQFRSLSEGAT